MEMRYHENVLQNAGPPDKSFMKTDISSKSDLSTISIEEAIPPLMKRIGIFIQQQDWKAATDYCERVLDLDPGISQVYIYKVLANRQMSDESELSRIDALMLDPNFQLALRFADAGEKKRLVRILRTIAENIPVERGNLREIEAILTVSRENQNEPEFAGISALLRRRIYEYVSLEDHPDPEMAAKFLALFPDDKDFQQIGVLLDLKSWLQTSEQCREEEAFYRSQAEKTGDPFCLKLAEACRQLGGQLKVQEIYRHAESLMEKKFFLAAAAEYERIPDYSDAAEKAASCRKIRFFTILSLVVSILAAGIFLIYNYNEIGASLGIADCQFGKAETLTSQGRAVEAVSWYKRAANQGNPNALIRLVRYYISRGEYSHAAEWAEKARRKDLQLSPLDLFLLGQKTSNAKWYRRAAKKGHVKSLLALGCQYEKEKRYAEAAQCYKRAAEKNSAEAQLRLGDCYYHGNGVKKNLKEAVKWYGLAAENGHSEAQIRLGYCYYHGNGVKKDLTEAVKWFICGGKNGNAAVQYLLGNCHSNGIGVKQNESEAAKWYRLAAEKGHTEAQYHLGNCYSNGIGVKQKESEAAKWYRLAAEKGHTEAQFNLGKTYSGWGLLRNLAEAAKWYRLAAEKGHSEAQVHLGNCYHDGWGVKENRVEAVRWYRLAAEKGNADAQYHLGGCYCFGWGVKENRVEAVKWYRLAAEKGNANAQHSLGNCYNYGWGVKKNYTEAVKWYRLAAKKGHSMAKDSLDLLSIYGDADAKRALRELGKE